VAQRRCQQIVLADLNVRQGAAVGVKVGAACVGGTVPVRSWHSKLLALL
jgi:hypothetical protein